MRAGHHEPAAKPFNDALHRIKNSQIVVVILPDRQRDVYPLVKRYCCCEAGLVSQCIQSKNITAKPSLSVNGKIVLQMATKIGAEPWILDNSIFVSSHSKLL